MNARRGERGATLAEFALMSSFVMMLLLGTVEAGRALATYHLVANAARLGTRWAMVRGATCTQTLTNCTPATANAVQDYVRSASAGIDPNALTVTTAWSSNQLGCKDATGQSAGCVVSVTASTTFTSPVPLLSLAPWTISSTSSMVIAQ